MIKNESFIVSAIIYNLQMNRIVEDQAIAR